GDKQHSSFSTVEIAILGVEEMGIPQGFEKAKASFHFPAIDVVATLGQFGDDRFENHAVFFNVYFTVFSTSHPHFVSRSDITKIEWTLKKSTTSLMESDTPPVVLDGVRPIGEIWVEPTPTRSVAVDR
ncbi:unnamed protein product, partial [marine sediment metagenome]